MKKRLVLGCRKSKLALAQAKLVEDGLRHVFPQLEFERKTFLTTGDKILNKALDKIGDKGLFTKEIEEALLKGEIDLAVHSLKDLPVELPKGLEIGAVPKREDHCDVLVSLGAFSLESLPKGARIGTSSLRRSAQLLNIRPDLRTRPLRGNLDTRIRKLEQGSYDAIILAAAGLKRLGVLDNCHCEERQRLLRPSLRTPATAKWRGAANGGKGGEAISRRVRNRLRNHVFEIASVVPSGLPRNDGSSGLAMTLIPLEKILPQAGQGALAIEIRSGDSQTSGLVRAIDDHDSHLCVDAERALLLNLGGGCSTPLGVYAEINNQEIWLKAGVFSLDGQVAIRDEVKGRKEDTQVLARSLARRMLKQGAQAILEKITVIPTLD